MDVKLQNAYVEVLLDNFMAVVKQNLMFQAQLEVMKSGVTESDEIKRKVKELSDRNVELQTTISSLENKLSSTNGEISTLKTTVDQKTAQAFSTDTLRVEKDRLQAAVNDYMRQVKKLQDEVNLVKSQSQDVLLNNSKRLDELSKYVDKLEQVVPANKLKKLKTNELPVVAEVVGDNVKAGGTF
jgi:chromosome segregation ATPase